MMLAALVTLLLATPSGNPTVASELGHAAALLRGGDVSGAQQAYRNILGEDPNNAAAQAGEVSSSEQLALAARARGDTDGALRILLAAQPLAPASPKLLFDLGVLEDSMKLYWDADKTVAKLEASTPAADPGVLYLAARVKMDLGQFPVAEQKMRAYLALKPDDASAHYGMGRMLQMEEHFDEARAEFERSLALQPQQTESYFQLGEIALAQERYEDAIAAYAHTLAGNPAHGGALAGTGIAWFRLKQYDKAADALRKALAAAPNYQPAHYYLGLTLARLGLKEESARELAQATAMAAAQNAQSAQRLRLNGATGARDSPAPHSP